MSAADSINELYHKHAPRWFKVIRWREWYTRFIQRQKECVFFFYLPLWITFYHTDNIMTHYIYFNRPKNDEELEILRRNTKQNVFQRNWELGQYKVNVPPRYDMWERRQKYPQYYAGRYDGFQRQGKAVLPNPEG